MRYTVWSHGRLIGETDLGFAPLIELARSGSFHPNAEGERLMPVVASVLPAMRAYLHRDAVDASGNGFVRPELKGSTLFADLAESFQHLLSLELELRREDGSVVPTAWIGLQDCHQLLELAEELEVFGDQEGAGDEPGSLGELDDIASFDDDLIPGDGPSDGVITDWAEDSCTEWLPDALDDHRFPRYQIHVELLHADAIP
jgi:hypothetical protein